MSFKGGVKMNPTIRNHKEKIIGYKAFKKDEKGLYTEDMNNKEKTYFEIGKEYKTEGKPELCENGLHFFRFFCFAIDYLEKDNVICKIESLGDVQEDTEKCVTNKLKILNIEYIDDHDIDNNSNSGNGNSGNGNSGYGNSGDGNSGYRNSGNWNSGDGYNNYFCTETKYFLFDTKCTKEERNEVFELDMSWFDLQDKTYKEAWEECPKEVIEQIKKLKNFNADKFFEITGIKA